MNRNKRDPYQQEPEYYGTPGFKDGIIFAEGVITKAQEWDIPIDQDPAILRETGDLNLEKQVPPQVYAVVAGVMDLIRKLEEEASHESDPGHTKHT